MAEAPIPKDAYKFINTKDELNTINNGILELRKKLITYDENKGGNRDDLLDYLDYITKELLVNFETIIKQRIPKGVKKSIQDYFIPNPVNKFSKDSLLFTNINNARETIKKLTEKINNGNLKKLNENFNSVNIVRIYDRTKEIIDEIEYIDNIGYLPKTKNLRFDGVYTPKGEKKLKPSLTIQEEPEETQVVSSPAVISGVTEEVQSPEEVVSSPAVISGVTEEVQSPEEEEASAPEEEKAVEIKIPEIEISEREIDPRDFLANWKTTITKGELLDNTVREVLERIEEFVEDEKDPMPLSSSVQTFLERMLTEEDIPNDIATRLTEYFRDFKDRIAFEINEIRQLTLDNDAFDELTDQQKQDVFTRIAEATKLLRSEDYEILFKLNGLSLNDLDKIISTYVRDFIDKFKKSPDIKTFQSYLRQIISEPITITPAKTTSKTSPVSSEFVGLPLTGSAMSSAGLARASAYGIDLPAGVRLVPIEAQSLDIDVPPDMKVEIDPQNTPFKDIRLADLTLNQIKAYQNLLSALPLAERIEALEYDQSEITGEDLSNPFTSVNYYSNPERDRSNPLYNITEQAERLYYKDAGKLYRTQSKMVPTKTQKHFPEDDDYLTFSQMPNISTYSGNKQYDETFSQVNTVYQGFDELRRDAQKKETNEEDFVNLFMSSLSRFD